MAFSDPQKIIEEFGLSEGATVADLGSGTGFYALAAARAVGDHGKIYAVDIQQGLLSRLKNLAHQEKANNTEVVHGDIEHPGGTRLKDGSVDSVIAGNVMFQIENKENFAMEIFRILKPSGRVLLVDWSDSDEALGPRPTSRVSEGSAKELFLKKGFSFVSSISAGDHHYGLIFRKP